MRADRLETEKAAAKTQPPQAVRRTGLGLALYRLEISTGAIVLEPWEKAIFYALCAVFACISARYCAKACSWAIGAP